MFSRVRSLAGALALGTAVVLTPATPTFASALPADFTVQQQSGLVNVEIYDLIDGDVLSNNKVAIGVAAQIAANVCGTTVQVGVLAQQLGQGGTFECENTLRGEGVRITQ